jgi:hypothetical protein
MRKYVLIIALITSLFLAASPVLAQDSSVTGEVPFIISRVAAGSITTTGVTISWETNGASTSQVFYDTASHSSTGEYPHSTTLDSNLVMGHSQTLAGLTSGQTFHYRVQSMASVSGNNISVTSSDMTFATLSSGTGGGGDGGGGTGGGTGGDGGGGGGSSDRIFLSGYQNPPGVFSQDFSVKAWNGMFTAIFPKGTSAKTFEGWALSYLTLNPIAKEKQSVPAPQGGNIIGLTYEAGPTGANFSLPVIINVLYDEALLPPDVREADLVVGYWNESDHKWEVLSDSKVDTTKNLISGTTSHFSIFAVLGIPPKSPLFSITSLNITPGEVMPGDKVTITAQVANNGDTAGDYEVILELDNRPVDSQKINLAAHSNRTISFTSIPSVVGTYTVDLNGLSGSFKVSPSGTVASFFMSDLKISESKVNVGQKVNITAKMTNNGPIASVYKVNLLLNAALAESREVTVGPGSSANVSFTITPETAGTYTVNLEGLYGTFEVIMPPALANFTISEITLTPDKPVSGDQVTLSALISNAGDLPGVYTVTVKLDGRVVKTDTLNLDGQSQQAVNYTLKVSAGDHRLQINEVSRQLAVEIKKGGSSLLMVGIIVGTIVIVMVTALTVNVGYRRSRYGVNS